jgi:hypothetical protein
MAPPQELSAGLYRWTARHPEWRPGADAGGPDDWGPLVGSALYEVSEAVVLFDPLLPDEDRDGFLQWLDGLVGGRPVSILTTIRWHRRYREKLADRYAANSARAWNFIPHGVEPRPLRGAGETVYWLPDVAALVFGDRLLGDDAGGVTLPPESWLRQAQVDRAGLARLMRPLTELPVERLLVSHGEPVLHDGRAALARAIRAAEQD